jgi:hypothetical protein
MAMVSLLIFSVSNATEVILEDTPNVGDTTTITTITSGNPASTGNLVSQDFDDGSWVGTMFPDSSDINESTWLTGKDGKYAETTIDSDDHLSLEELQLGFTSNFGAQIRWWNPVESTVTLTQTATNGVDTTTQSTTFHDTTNHNYQTNPYSNQLTLAPDAQNQHGTLTVRFSFDIQGNKNYNGGHAGVDVRDPVVTVDYNTLSTTTSTSVVYCWQKNPPTCPGQDELEDVQEQLEPEPIEEEPIQEEIINEEIAEQPSSEEVVTDEPAPTAEIAKQEEAIQEPAQEQPSSDVEVDLDIKVAAIEKAIQSKIKNEMQRVSVTLDVINEVVSREMTSTQADISSYFNTNAALFDTRQLPSGDPAFFLQASLASYDKTIYATQASIAGTDPVVQHQIKMREHKKKTSDAYRNLMELLNARNVQ